MEATVGCFKLTVQQQLPSWLLYQLKMREVEEVNVEEIHALLTTGESNITVKYKQSSLFFCLLKEKKNYITGTPQKLNSHICIFTKPGFCCPQLEMEDIERSFASIIIMMVFFCCFAVTCENDGVLFVFEWPPRNQLVRLQWVSVTVFVVIGLSQAATRH